MSHSIIKITNQVQINVPKSKVWEIVSDFGNVSRWGPLVTQSATTSPNNQGVGAERSCEVLQLGSITEKVIGWDEGNSITIDVKGIPGVYSLVNQSSLSGEGDQTVVKLETEVDIKGTEEEKKGFEEQFHGALQLTVEGLKQYAETGQKMAPPSAP